MRDRSARSRSPAPNYAHSTIREVPSRDGLRSDRGSHHNRSVGGNHHPQQNYQHSTQHNFRSQSPVSSAPPLPKPPPSSRRSSATSIDPSDLMDIGSDEHMRKSREVERRKSGDLKGMRGSMHKSPSIRDSSPARSVQTAISTPNLPLRGLLPNFRRNSSKDCNSHSSSSSVGPMPTATVERDHSGGERRYRRSHADPPQSRAPDNHALSPAAYPPHQGYELPLEAPVVVSTMHDDAQAYPTSPSWRVQGQTANISNSPVVRRRNVSNPDLTSSRSDVPPHSREQVRRATFSDGGSSHSGSRSNSGVERDSSTANDEEFKLALELSLKEAEAEEIRKRLAARMANERHTEDRIPRSPRKGGRTSHERISGGDGSRSPYRPRTLASNPSSLAQEVPPSEFGLAAYKAAKPAAASDEMDDELLLALKLSEQECKAPNKADALKPDEQARILQQIQEEKERKELEMALKASQAESHNHLRPAPPNDIRPYVSNPTTTSGRHTRNTSVDPRGNGPNDFLISQQKALEEYKRNRSQTATRPAPARMKDPPPSQEADELLLKGAMETQQAISSGRAHIVKCQKCGARLQAPLNYSLVYCPQCQTVSPA